LPFGCVFVLVGIVRRTLSTYVVVVVILVRKELLRLRFRGKRLLMLPPLVRGLEELDVRGGRGGGRGGRRQRQGPQAGDGRIDRLLVGFAAEDHVDGFGPRRPTLGGIVVRQVIRGDHGGGADRGIAEEGRKCPIASAWIRHIHAWVDDAHTWTQGVEAIAYGLKGQRC
jgi:hypothetical protein